MRNQTSFDTPKAAAEHLRSELYTLRKERAEASADLLRAAMRLARLDRAGLAELDTLADRVLATTQT